MRAPSARRASPSASLAIAATDNARRAPGLATGIGLREARVMATQPEHPEVIARRNYATGVQAHGCTSASRLMLPLAAVPRITAHSKMVRPPPAGPAQIMDAGAFRPARIGHPRAGGRGDGPRAAGAENWPPGSGCA
jgi:hypothetical protein